MLLSEYLIAAVVGAELESMERVLFLSLGIEFGGLEVILLDWFSAIDYSRTEVVLGCREPDIFREKIAAKGLKVELFQLEISGDEPFWRALVAWLRALSSLRPHKVVFLEGGFAQFPLAAVLSAWWVTRNRALLFLCGWGRRPRPDTLPHSLYGIRQLLHYRLRNLLFRSSFTISQDLKDNLVNSYGYHPNPIKVLYHGVDASQFKVSPADRADFREALGIPAQATLIACPGRMARIKRQDRIVKAFRTVSQEQDGLWLLLTAYGPLKEDVEKIVADSGLAHHVRLVPFQQDTSKLLKAGDIYIMASDSEGFPIALLEAMASGLVCVATDCGGPREIIEDGKNGFLVEVSDEAVVQGLRRAIKLQPEERTRMGALARKTVEERCEVRAMVRNALEAYEIPHS